MVGWAEEGRFALQSEGIGGNQAAAFDGVIERVGEGLMLQKRTIQLSYDCPTSTARRSPMLLSNAVRLDSWGFPWRDNMR